MHCEFLSEVAQKVLQDQHGLSDVSISWGRPQDSAHGDVATPVCLQVAKSAGKSPREIAESIAPQLEESDKVAKVEIAGPGYINVWLTPDVLLESLQETQAACVPQKARKDEDPVLVEYSQPNIAKPLGIHHVISTCVGQAIANLYIHLGYNLETVNHIGDWGTQFGKLFVAYSKWGEKPVEECAVADLLKLYVRFHEEAEVDNTLEDEGREAFLRLEQGDKELHAFWKVTLDTSLKELFATYDRLHVHIEHQHGESLYEDMMAPIIEEGKAKGVFKPGKDGALIAEFPEETHMPPAIVLKKDGATIYHTRDLATVRYRVDRWHPRAIYHVVDVSQQLYFQQLIAMGGQLGWDLPHWEHLIIGRMSFTDRKMSTRKGNILLLEAVLDEAVERASVVIKEHGEKIQTDNSGDLAEMMGVGSVVYGVLSQNRKMDMTFDWDKFLSFEGNSAPYLQYTHARARSVLKKAGGEQKSALPKGVSSLTDNERDLANTLLQFGDVVEEACKAHMPHILCNYLYLLCQSYNAFYNADSILKAEEPQRSLRLCLTQLTASVLKSGAEILTIRVPDRM